MMKKLMRETSLATTALLLLSAQAFAVPQEQEVLEHYTVLAHAVYEDSLITARDLQKAVNRLIAKPTEENLHRARMAWKAARVPYQQSEVYRFGNAIVDDWEGKVNAWPLDEGLIDYVASSYGAESEENPGYRANVIASPSFTFSGHTIDAQRITKDLLAGTLHELGGVEANVATGYHAIEFLLWGQDLNGTGPGLGHPSGKRLRSGQLLLEELRTAGGLPEIRYRSAGRRPDMDGCPMGARRGCPRRVA